ncbi:MAG: sigma-70 family RNA polymerase sigma factor [Cyclobacteriaceae bacterium]|nr:sigma-70 family RNA polymerase sigma factor [Cyclobacteriaceae bacterium]
MMQRDTFKNITQNQLITGVKENDALILKWIYQQNFAKIRQLIMQNKGDEEQAKDIYQEAFTAFWMNVKSGKFQPENGSAISGYLYQIAKNKWLDYLRSAEFKKSTNYENHHDITSGIEEDRESLFVQLENAFKHLGDGCQSLLRKFYFQKQSMEEIAQAFGWTPASARNNKYRCVQQLREKIKGISNK